ncbi:MAG: hypothetical protein I3273_03625 [Candidatus Moeniiplasma glomeromycotorum]|nr:hypothetical protein [Candidatus Moeniiplasma glomeromycotorum]MCE8169186.1 hypothetical protein [Candidatus Moeniiplasma glomeromycotorum]
MTFKNKNRKIILIIVFSVILLLLLGVGIYLLAGNKNQKNKEEQTPFKEKEDKIEFLVKFNGIIRGKWYFFTKENMTNDRLIYVDKDHSVFSLLSIKPKSDSYYYLKILKSQKEETFFGKNDYVELSKK